MFIYSPEGIGVSVTCTKPGPPFWPRQGSLKAFDWLQREAGSPDWRRWACWYNCRLSERGGGGGGSSACSVLDEARHSEVLSGAWERKMTNQAARGSAGGDECEGWSICASVAEVLAVSSAAAPSNSWTRREIKADERRVGWLPDKHSQTSWRGCWDAAKLWGFSNKPQPIRKHCTWPGRWNTSAGNYFTPIETKSPLKTFGSGRPIKSKRLKKMSGSSFNAKIPLSQY